MARIASMSVYDKATGREIVRGDVLRSHSGRDEYRLICAASPTVPGKSGKVYVTLPEGGSRELYAHFFDVVVKGWMDCGCPVGPDAPGHRPECGEWIIWPLDDQA